MSTPKPQCWKCGEQNELKECHDCGVWSCNPHHNEVHFTERRCAPKVDPTIHDPIPHRNDFHSHPNECVLDETIFDRKVKAARTFMLYKKQTKSGKRHFVSWHPRTDEWEDDSDEWEEESGKNGWKEESGNHCYARGDSHDNQNETWQQQSNHPPGGLAMDE